MFDLTDENKATFLDLNSSEIRGAESEPEPDKTLLYGKNRAELLALKEEIDGVLGFKTLDKIDLEKEVIYQLTTAKNLIETVIEDDDVQTNQKAQVINSCTAILDRLVKMQVDLFNAERIKAMESALIRCLKELPLETQNAFFERYEEALKQAS